jgi:myo-inositol-1(or 4)-monophosphatase
MQADRQLLGEAEAVCVEAVRQAGSVLLEYFRTALQVDFKAKGKTDPVTEADRHSEALLRQALTSAFPQHGIIGEEQEDALRVEADYVWFLDPLDGTANFTAGLPAFAVSMGLCFRGRPVLGVIAVPWEGPGGTVFRARQDGGAFCNDAAIQVAPADLPAGTRLVSMPFWSLWQYRMRQAARMRQTNIRASGSIAYELAYAAHGVFQFSIISGARLWDMVAGVVLVQEAGGATLFSNSTVRRWDDWTPFLRRALARPFGHDAAALRKLHINILAGNPQLVRERSARIVTRRPSALGKAKQQLRRAWKGPAAPATPPEQADEPPASPAQK